MSSIDYQNAGNRREDFLTSVWNRIRAHLENEKTKIYEEIRNYPRPVPACDQQFNYLLEERARRFRRHGVPGHRFSPGGP